MITHPEKLMFPDDGITKGELAAYYETIAPYMLPHLTGRPITMERYNRGIAAEGFFQKDVTKGFPKWLEPREVCLPFRSPQTARRAGRAGADCEQRPGTSEAIRAGKNGLFFVVSNA